MPTQQASPARSTFLTARRAKAEKPFVARAFVFRDGSCAHPDCLLQASKLVDSRYKYGNIEAMRRSWPRGAACLVCSGSTCAPFVK